jgi:hypothetical protein
MVNVDGDVCVQFDFNVDLRPHDLDSMPRSRDMTRFASLESPSISR